MMRRQNAEKFYEGFDRIITQESHEIVRIVTMAQRFIIRLEASIKYNIFFKVVLSIFARR